MPILALATIENELFGYAGVATLIGRLVRKRKGKKKEEQSRGKLAAPDEIRVATLFSFGYLIKIV